MSKASASIQQRALNARNFFNQENKVIAIGKSTPWVDSVDIDVTDRNPPTPTGNETTIEEFIACKRIDVCYLCTKSDDGDLIYRDQHFMTTQDLDVAKDGLYDCVYVKASLIYDEVPLDTYRQVALYSFAPNKFNENGVMFAEGKNDNPDYIVTPEELGIMAVLDYRKPQPRDWDQTETFEFMIQF